MAENHCFSVLLMFDGNDVYRVGYLELCLFRDKSGK